MEKTKLTKKEKFEILKGIVEASALSDKEKAECVEFIEKEQKALIRKSNAPTKSQKQNAEIAEKVIEAIAGTDEALTGADILAIPEVAEIRVEVKGELKPLTAQKLTAIMKILVDGGRVVKDNSGKKVVYSIVD